MLLLREEFELRMRNWESLYRKEKARRLGREKGGRDASVQSPPEVVNLNLRQKTRFLLNS